MERSFSSRRRRVGSVCDKATAELGRVITEGRIDALVRALKAVKADESAPVLQKEFFDRVKN